jgi:hypothetical protein
MAVLAYFDTNQAWAVNELCVIPTAIIFRVSPEDPSDYEVINLIKVSWP